MKKLLGILFMLGFVLTLAACGNKDTDNDVVTDDVAITDDVAADDAVDVEEESEIKTKLKEYQLTFDLTSSDGAGNDMEMSMDIYQKDDSILYVMNKMPDMGDTPFVTHRSLTTNGKNYVEMEINGENHWFVAEGMGDTLLADQMFNLEEMQDELEASASDVQKEKIDGKKMVCYYQNDGVQEGKACTYDGVFAYAESDMLDGSNIHTVMKISNYKEKVKDSMFDEPKDAKDMMELMGMMGG